MSIAHQAGAVSLGGRAMLIEGAPGSGKSSLALALIDRGADLVGDDGVLLDPRADTLWLLPHPNTAGLIEVRNVGILTLPAQPARAALLIVLDKQAPRHVEKAETVQRGGIALPAIRLWPDTPVLAIRAETALSRHGLRF